ncbi:MAG: S8 family peptidase [Elusimicrobia bacterium]|nr:S8 family peptidase [Elusimicrobiota bacterium]MDE2512110.1 S8 family peptidase [Elusimicrobiota bacterium]
MKKSGHSWTIWALAALAAAALNPRPALARGRHHKKRLLVTFVEGTNRAERAQAAKDMGLTVTDDMDSLEVSVLESAGDVQPQEVTRARKHAKVFQVEEDVYRNWLLDSPASFQASPLPSVESVLQSLARAPRRPAPAPADPNAGDSASPRGSVPWGVARVNAPAAWASGQGQGVKVAVIDTGIDCTHPDLQCDFGAGVNFVDPSANPMDDNEHGTHVAGTIAGRGTGGPLGVAPKATLIPVKVLDADGAGSLSDIVKGINWAANAGVDVINMSLGGPTGSAALQRAVNKALAAGVVVVCAAGNSGPNPDTVGFPGGYPGVIAVAASDSNDRVANFSSRGDAVAFIAPGVDIVSTVPGGGTAKLSGTSMASPHVAGLAALAVERGARGADGVRRAFTAAASKLDGLGPTEQGAGMIDASKLR